MRSREDFFSFFPLPATCANVPAMMRQRIREIELRHVQIPFHEPFRISTAEVAVKDAIVLKLTTDAGVGYGEASPMAGAFYNDETPATNWTDLIENQIPALVSGGPIAAEDVADVLDRVSSQQFAKAGLESAFYVAEANSVKVPLWKLLRGSNRPIPSGLAVGIYSTADELLARIEQYLADGYQRVKIKIKPGWDAEPVGRVRERWPTLPLMVDANAAYDASHMGGLCGLAPFARMMIEQPFAIDALDESAELQRRIRTPICLDESAETLETVRTICEKRAGRIINIKMQRVGGIRRSVQIHDLARERGLPCWLGTMPELGIASATGLHLATLANFTFPTDVESSDRWFVDDVLEPPIVVDAGGFLHFPTGPGLGYRPSPEKIRKYTVREEIIQP